ncbi:hypothetical protein J4219_00855 [Candidatus Woesearchaeota archaeon]|nr:hypothetical protein [Candidatus Woesearchaeota archaeon]
MDEELRRLERSHENDLRYPAALFRAGRYRDAAGPLSEYLKSGDIENVIPFLPNLAKGAPLLSFIENEKLVQRPAIDVCWQYASRTPSYRVLLAEEGLFSFDLLALQWFDLNIFGVRNIPEPERNGWWYLPIWESRQQSDELFKLYTKAALENLCRRAA